MKQAGKLHTLIIDVESRYLEPLSRTDRQTDSQKPVITALPQTE
jgi:hypothetical protein